MTETKLSESPSLMNEVKTKWLTSWFNYVTLVLIIIQYMLLTHMKPLATFDFWSILALIIVIFLGCKWCLERTSIPGLFENFSVSWAFGGLGMLLGHHVDAGAFSHHAAHHLSLMSFITSGMTIGMLVFCIPACIVFCNKKLVHLSQGSKCLLHIGSSAFMLVGMLVAVLVSSHAFAPANNAVFFDHFFMLLLMVIFSNIAYAFIVNCCSNANKTLEELH